MFLLKYEQGNKIFKRRHEFFKLIAQRCSVKKFATDLN